MIRVSEPIGARHRLAIVGSGISGLVCAHHLHREADLTIFEANDYVGGHTNTVDVEAGGRAWAVDTGFIVFNELNYPHFTALLAELGVASRPSTMSFSVRCDRTGVEYNGTSLNTLFAQRRNLVRPAFHGMIRDILRFNREALEVLAWNDARMTVGEYLHERGYGERFVDHYLVPMGSAIWSSPPGAFRRFPIRFVVEFMRNHRMLQVEGRPAWRVVADGSRTYVDALIEPFRHCIRLSRPVTRVRRRPDGVELITGRNDVERFDAVIFACHADQALAMLDDPSPVEQELLGAFPYQPNEAVLHTDASVLPRRRRARAAWNFHLRAGETSAATVTYDLNALQGLDAPVTFCVTLNESDLIDPRRVIDRFVYDHPLYGPDRDRAQRRHEEVIGVNRTSFCGAYWGYGFHEDGVRSALRVCETLARQPA